MSSPVLPRSMNTSQHTYTANGDYMTAHGGDTDRDKLSSTRFVPVPANPPEAPINLNLDDSGKPIYTQPGSFHLLPAYDEAERDTDTPLFLQPIATQRSAIEERQPSLIESIKKIEGHRRVSR